MFNAPKSPNWPSYGAVGLEEKLQPESQAALCLCSTCNLGLQAKMP
jgi:hypothetical protein